MSDSADYEFFKSGDKLLRGIPLVCVDILENTPVAVRHIDDRLITAWQNYCAQVQGEYTGYWNKYIAKIREVNSVELSRLTDIERKAIARACRDALFIGGLFGPFEEEFFANESAFIDVIYELVQHEAKIDEDEAVRAVVPRDAWMR